VSYHHHFGIAVQCVRLFYETFKSCKVFLQLIWNCLKTCHYFQPPSSSLVWWQLTGSTMHSSSRMSGAEWKCPESQDACRVLRHVRCPCSCHKFFHIHGYRRKVLFC
jgi:hypothetical protein